MPVLSSYVCDHAVSLRISVNTDFSTADKYLASGKKPIEQLHPVNSSTGAVTVLHTSCTIYLWNVNVHGPCPTPLDRTITVGLHSTITCTAGLDIIAVRFLYHTKSNSMNSSDVHLKSRV